MLTLRSLRYWAMAAGEDHADALHNLLVHADDAVPADEIVGKVGGGTDWTKIETKLEEPLAKAIAHLQFFASNLYRFGHGVEQSEERCLECVGLVGGETF
jgi:hypothetical protein